MKQDQEIKTWLTEKHKELGVGLILAMEKINAQQMKVENDLTSQGRGKYLIKTVIKKI